MLELAPAGGNQFELGVAGDTYNTAVYLKRLLKASDVDVSYVTAVGDDPNSARLMEALHEEGINASYVAVREGMSPGLYMISVDSSGERSFSYWRSAAAARTLFDPEFPEVISDMSEFDLVYLSGISVAILPAESRTILKTKLADFRQNGGVVAFDSNYRPALWDSADVARTEITEFYRQADIALPSVDDEALLFDDQDSDDALKRFKELGVKCGALKRGSSGPVSLDGAEVAVPNVASDLIVDSTAAGDSFNAGFLAGFMEGRTAKECMLCGHELAARVIQHRGAIIEASKM